MLRSQLFHHESGVESLFFQMCRQLCRFISASCWMFPASHHISFCRCIPSALYDSCYFYWQHIRTATNFSDYRHIWYYCWQANYMITQKTPNYHVHCVVVSYKKNQVKFCSWLLLNNLTSKQKYNTSRYCCQVFVLSCRRWLSVFVSSPPLMFAKKCLWS